MKKGFVYVLSYYGGVLGVFANKMDAYSQASDYERYDYKGVKVEFLPIK